MDIPAILDTYTLITALLCLCSILGYGIYFYRSSYTGSNSGMNKLFLSSIFFSDQFVIIAHAFPSIVAARMQNWPFGDAGCQWHAFVGILGCIASTGSTLSLVFNYCYSNRLKGTPAWLMIASVWLFSCVCAYFPTFVYGNYAFESDLNITCGLDYNNMKNGFEFFFVVFMMVMIVLAPALIIYICFKNNCTKEEMMFRNALIWQSLISTFPYFVFGAYILAQHGNTDSTSLILFNVTSMIFFKLKIATNPFINLVLLPTSTEQEYSMLSLLPNKKCIPKCSGNMYTMQI